MEQIKEHLIFYCKSSSMKECMAILKKKITKQSQMELYDYIYNDYVYHDYPAGYNEDTILKGLDAVVKLFVFAQVYKYKIYKKEENIELAEEKLLILNKYLNMHFTVI